MNKTNKAVSPVDQLKADVLVSELRARYNKSQFEYMYYFVEADKLQPLFMETLAKKEQERLEAEKEVMTQIQSQVKEQNIESEVKEVPAV